jgi:hypothetical protein
MMPIYIPSLGRAGRQITLAALPKAAQQRALVVVPAGELRAYTARVPAHVHVLPCPAVGITRTREWIARHAAAHRHAKLLMLDDDLRFYRRMAGTVKLRKVAADDMMDMLALLERWLDETPHVAVSAREGNNRVEAPHAWAGRALRALGFRTKEYLAMAATPRVDVMEDFDTFLRLMRQGWANKITYEFAQNQDGGSQAAGGCSTYRTTAVQAAAAHKLAALHPEFVDVVEKQTKVSWKGEPRTDVKVYWKKAWLSGLPEELK